MFVIHFLLYGSWIDNSVEKSEKKNDQDYVDGMRQ